jgi:hypothetical protein
VEAPEPQRAEVDAHSPSSISTRPMSSPPRVWLTLTQVQRQRMPPLRLTRRTS